MPIMLGRTGYALGLILAVIDIHPTWAGSDSHVLDEVVVTAPNMEDPLTVTNNPKAPQQPVPANDGASFLKNIPGFNMIRKGGSDGDPVFRGLAGSRLNLVIDGAELLGGCGMRMDPPTAYVFPELYDKVTLIKGPQTVRYGNGNSAGVVLFDRDVLQLTKSGIHARGSVTAGSWGRIDGVASSSIGGDTGFVQAAASHAESGNYVDGGGRDVHSEYRRQSLTGMAGWTPDSNTRIILDAVASNAKVGYADRTMDGVKFDRKGGGLKAEKENVSAVIKKVSGQVYYNYIDHVMDNYSLRTLKGSAMVNNPDRKTQGARAAVDLGLSATTLLTIGLDWQSNTHTLRSASGAAAYNYNTLPRSRDMETSIKGLYTELRQDLSDSSRLIAGLRYDAWTADRYNKINGGFLAHASESLKSGFLRYEQDLDAMPITAYLGLGYSERPMDYWEASTYNGLTAASKIDSERNIQVDSGMIWTSDTLSSSLSLFYSRINDYILIWNDNTPSSTMDDKALNVNATRWGGELEGAWRFIPNWTLRGSLTYLYGENNSMHTPLAQTSPLEGRLGLDYSTGPWTFAGMLRIVAKQDRVQTGYGSIVGFDLGPTSGFTTLAINSSYRLNKQWLISAGVDNLLDTDYAEHISRSGSAIAGFTQNTRVDEPGRFLWLKVTAEY